MRVRSQFEYLLHHVISLMGAALSLYLGGYNIPLAAACLLSETSDIFMNIRWFMLTHKLFNLTYKLINILFLLTFLLSRVVVLLLLVIKASQASQKNFGLQSVNNLLLLGLWCLQVWWFAAVISAV